MCVGVVSGTLELCPPPLSYLVATRSRLLNGGQQSSTDVKACIVKGARRCSRAEAYMTRLRSAVLVARLLTNPQNSFSPSHQQRQIKKCLVWLKVRPLRPAVTSSPNTLSCWAFLLWRRSSVGQGSDGFGLAGFSFSFSRLILGFCTGAAKGSMHIVMLIPLVQTGSASLAVVYRACSSS